MNEYQTPSKNTGGIRKVTPIDRLEDEGRSTVVSKILGTREVRELLGNLLPQVFTTLAGEGKMKRFAFKKAGNYIKKSLSRPDDVLEKSELPHLFEEEAFVNKVQEMLPDITDELTAAMTGMLKTIESLPVKDKKEVFSNLFAKRDSSRQGEMMNSFARIITDIHKEDPEFLTHTLGPNMADCLDGIDFGELKVFLDGTFKDVALLAKTANDAMFDKPAKVVLVLAILPSLMNMMTTILKDTVTRFNVFPPDIVADVVLSIFREVDGKTVGGVLNEAMELFRKINVGSALIGDPGMPRCRLDMAAFIDDMTSEIDVALLWKFRELLAMSKERMHLSQLSILKKKPELVIERLRNAPKVRNYGIRATKQNMGLVEDLPEAKSVEALKEGIGDIDANAVAEIINSVSLMVNRLNNSDPDLLPDLAEEFVNSLDLYEVEDAVQSTMENIGDVIEPLGSIIFPNLIRMATNWLSSNGNGQSEEMIQAREVISQFLNNSEVAV